MRSVYLSSNFLYMYHAWGNNFRITNFELHTTESDLVYIKLKFVPTATQCVAPFTTLLLKALGLTVQETGFIYTIGPLIPVIAPFIAGVIADKVGNFRVS